MIRNLLSPGQFRFTRIVEGVTEREELRRLDERDGRVDLRGGKG